MHYKIFLLVLSLFTLSSPALVRAAANVTFDNQGTWIVNGKRWFFYGTHNIPRLQGTGHIDAANWERAEDYYHLTSTVATGAPRGNNLATEHNMYLIQGIPWVKDVTSYNTPEAKDRVRTYIDRSRSLFFYASEENVVGHELILPGYDYLSSTFPTVPAHINFTGMDTRYFIPGLKDYVTRTKAAILSSHVGNAQAMSANMAKLRDELPSLKSVYMLFRKDENPQLEEDIFLSIVNGVNGIFFWELSQPNPAESDTYSGNNWGEVIARVGGYLAEIQPGLVAPNREYKTGYLLSKGEDNRYYVIATPTGNALSVTGLPANTEFEKLFYNPGTVTTNAQGTLTDNASGKIKIYRQKLTSKPGDLNSDGTVNLLDYNLLKTGFGTTYNLLNYNQLVQQFGQ